MKARKSVKKSKPIRKNSFSSSSSSDKNNKKNQTSKEITQSIPASSNIVTNPFWGDKVEILQIPQNEYEGNIYHSSLSHCQQNQIFISSYRHKLFDKNAILNKQRIKQQLKRTFANLKLNIFRFITLAITKILIHMFLKNFQTSKSNKRKHRSVGFTKNGN